MNRRPFTPKDLLTRYGHDQNVMNYFGIDLRLWLNKTPIQNYKNSRGLR